MPEPEGPAGRKAASPAQPAAQVSVLADSRITIDRPAFEVFAALTDPDRLAAWWGEDAVVEADEGGRYEATMPIGRVEGTITAIDGPGTLAFAWPLPAEGISVVTSVRYTLVPKGMQTSIRVAHRAPREVPGDWRARWQSALEALKAYVERTAAAEPSDASSEG